MPTSDEFAAVVHLAEMFGEGLGDEIANELADLLGFSIVDNRWITPYGRDVTALCDASANGGFSSSQWTFSGWMLDDSSMRALANEFPDEML